MRNYRMNKTQQQRYESLYEQHVNALKRQGKSESTIDVAYRDVSKGREHDCMDAGDTISLNQLQVII